VANRRNARCKLAGGDAWRDAFHHDHCVLYMVTAYTPTFGSSVLHLAPVGNLTVTLCVGMCNLLILPLSGALSDRVGRRPILITCTVAALITAYPALLWLAAGPSFARACWA